MQVSDIKGSPLKVLIRNHESTIFEGEAKAFTAYNDKGIFDVLPEHANFISIIKKRFIIHKSDGSKLPMDIKSGVLRVTGNAVHVFLDITNQM